MMYKLFFIFFVHHLPIKKALHLLQELFISSAKPKPKGRKSKTFIMKEKHIQRFFQECSKVTSKIDLRINFHKSEGLWESKVTIN
jgi:hypothetical protein